MNKPRIIKAVRKNAWSGALGATFSIAGLHCTERPIAFTVCFLVVAALVYWSQE